MIKTFQKHFLSDRSKGMEDDDDQPQPTKASAVDEEENAINPQAVIAESKSFLEYLQESNPTYPELLEDYEEFNGGTLRTGNTRLG